MAITLNGNLLELCVLGLVYREDQYGYRLTRQMKEKFDLSESSLYPVLRRLTRSGLLRTYDLPYDGRMRRYYALTEEGKEMYYALRAEWMTFSKRINEVLPDDGVHDSAKGEMNDDQS
ncbi:PadR family transcriptional regulator [Allobaculum mucilyticum]|uniref:PadR family transcriptional regulator n=1 Tax=Allobaculum mucilyticum TaxID=2834459 RepID=UPI001E2F0344|nr:PadR family transcriptional regulator [Allobaculum mucilyticum]UNT97180.1 PadR family transcriptional regulator [Allobaculum mucilyticum]